MTVAIITVVMRGLVKKGDYDTAYRLWNVWLKVSKRDRIIDKRSLTVAMIVLVGDGHPLEAWDTLISATSILTADGGQSQPRIKIPGRKKRQAPVKADTTMVNSLMSAFLDSGRTDMVFKLWEAFNSNIIDDRLLELCGDLAEEHVAGKAGQAGDGGAEWKDVGIWKVDEWTVLIGKVLGSMRKSLAISFL